MSYTAPTALTGSSVGFIGTLTWGPSFLVGSGPELLLHFDGTNGQTTTVDSSSNAWPVTMQSTGSLSTASPKFGTAAFNITAIDPILQPAPAFVPYTSGSGLDIFGLSAWTVEMQFFVEYNTDPGVFLLNYGGSPTPGFNPGSLLFVAQANADTSIGVGIINNGTFSGVSDVSFSMPIGSVGSWHHLALVNDGVHTTMYIDGVASGSPSSSWNAAQYSGPYTTPNVVIGAFGGYSGGRQAGQIDELRVMLSAVYNANFTPPAAPFTSSGTPAPGYDVYREGVSIATFLGPPGFTDTVPVGGIYSYYVTAWGPDPSVLLLLLHFDGSNGDTTTTDSSSLANPMTFIEPGIALRTGGLTSPVGDTAILGLVSGGYNNSLLSTPIAPAGPLDLTQYPAYTIEGFIYVPSGSSNIPIIGFGQCNGGSVSSFNGVTLFYLGSSILQLSIYGATSGPSEAPECTNFTENAWHHVAIVKQPSSGTGDQYQLFVDGIGSGWTNSAGFMAPYSPWVGYYVLGGYWSGPLGYDTYVSGGAPMSFSEVRVMSSAVYTTNFTPPAAPFTVPSSDLSAASNVIDLLYGLIVPVYGKFVQPGVFKPNVQAAVGLIEPRVWMPFENRTVRP